MSLVTFLSLQSGNDNHISPVCYFITQIEPWQYCALEKDMLKNGLNSNHWLQGKYLVKGLPKSLCTWCRVEIHHLNGDRGGISQPCAVDATFREAALTSTAAFLKETCIWGLNQLEISQQNPSCGSCPRRSGLAARLATPIFGHSDQKFWVNKTSLGVECYPSRLYPTSPCSFLSLAQRGTFTRWVKGPDTLTVMRNQLGRIRPLSKVMPHSTCLISGLALH